MMQKICPIKIKIGHVCRYFYLYSVAVSARYHFRVVSIFILAINHQMNYFMAASPAQPWSW